MIVFKKGDRVAHGSQFGEKPKQYTSMRHGTVIESRYDIRYVKWDNEVNVYGYDDMELVPTTAALFEE